MDAIKVKTDLEKTMELFDNISAKYTLSWFDEYVILRREHTMDVIYNASTGDRITQLCRQYKKDENEVTY
jgi:hypothetical protein